MPYFRYRRDWALLVKKGPLEYLEICHQTITLTWQINSRKLRTHKTLEDIYLVLSIWSSLKWKQLPNYCKYIYRLFSSGAEVGICWLIKVDTMTSAYDLVPSVARTSTAAVVPCNKQVFVAHEQVYWTVISGSKRIKNVFSYVSSK